jgi:hypothetical protein
MDVADEASLAAMHGAIVTPEKLLPVPPKLGDGRRGCHPERSA